MKTTIEIDGCEIVIEKEGDTITVSACKGGECMEEFSVECGGDENLPEESEMADDAEMDADEAEEEADFAEEDADEAEEDAEEAEEDMEEPKLESFNSFVSKKNKKK